MVIGLMSDEHVKEIFNWRYESPYDVYNMPTYKIAKEAKFSITIEEKRKVQYRSITKLGKLVAYFRVQVIDDSILLGLGIKPELCGRGEGKFLVKEFINYIKKNYNGFYKIRLQVRKFNVRAMKCYRAVGFYIVGEDETFYNMEYMI